jgi:hypothetical protein
MMHGHCSATVYRVFYHLHAHDHISPASADVVCHHAIGLGTMR